MTTLKLYDRVRITGDGLSGRVGTICDTVDDDEAGNVPSFYVQLDCTYDDPDDDGSAPTYPVRAERLEPLQ